MNFIEAINKLQKKCKLYRKSWLNEHSFPDFIYYDNVYDEYLDEKNNGYLFYNEDYLANDWEEIGGKLYSFEQALKAYKSGKAIRKFNSNKCDYIQRYSVLSIEDILANDWEIL